MSKNKATKTSILDFQMGPDNSRNRVITQVGRSLRYHRHSLGMTQQELADRMGFNRTYLGAIERGEKNMSLLTLVNLCKCLEVNIVDVLSHFRF